MMRPDPFSEKKRFLDVGEARIAYVEEGNGDPLLLLHGCPFSSFIWRNVILRLSPHYRCLAPDILGLGDTETPEAPTGRSGHRRQWCSASSMRWG